ncbi:hypothetical protein AH03_39 [Erwinia phage AH03]|uniref:Uncharacterized protein n=1 Tax=Erwinia phage AH03 TaxID=2869568 RepID=A0AAE7X216_9CAUD|nr:hypothetical protein AH03_39 [Erwinia phage AH03]
MVKSLLKLPVILNFINGPLPSEGDKKAAEKYDGKAKVVYRNAHHVQDGDSLEKCDGVMGAVPPRYKERYSTADDAVKFYESEKKELSDKVGDDAVPNQSVTNVDSVAEPLVKQTPTTDKKAASVWKAGK